MDPRDAPSPAGGERQVGAQALGRPAAPAGPKGDLAVRYAAVRAETEALCRPLETEDYVVSSMPDVSPAKWHLAHSSWFFETFVLAPFAPAYASPDPRFALLFNSYYVAVGARFCRARRGILGRPTVAEIFAHRARVDEAMHTLLERIRGDEENPAAAVVELGLAHEEQHQELLLTDLKHVFWSNPLRPAYAARGTAAPESRQARAEGAELRWIAVPEGLYWIGHEGPGFAFDNERPAHRVFVDGFRIASRLVTNGEYLAFIEDGGYRRPELWLAAGWTAVQERQWEAPLYWERDGSGFTEFTLAGTRPLDLHAPVCHVSYYEADAFARWAGHRLLTEAEWEIAARGELGDSGDGRRSSWPPLFGSAPPSDRIGPAPRISDLYGAAWQWTRSPHVAYPGHVRPAGALGEYNAKWMSDQWVLRGASCATPRSHARVTYRNYFPADARWQFAGIRLGHGP